MEPEAISFLTDDENKALLPSVHEKLLAEWRSKQNEISNLQLDIEKTKTNSEQSKFQLEKDLVEIRKQLKDEGLLKEEAQEQLLSLKEKIASQEVKLQDVEEKSNSLLRQLEQCRSDLQEASSQCAASAASLEAKTKLNNELSEQISNLEEHLASAQKSKCDALIKAEEANTCQLQIQHKERRFEQEKVMLTRQIELLKQQLEQRSEEVLTMRWEHSTSVINLQSDLTRASEEARILSGEKEATQKVIEEKTKRIEELMKSLNETRESEVQLETTYRKELTAQQKLANIYKQSSEDQQKRSEELEKAVEQLKQLLQEASEQFGALEKAKGKSEEDAQKALDQRDVLIKELKDELYKVNELLKSSARREDCLSELSPAASAASQLMSKGLTLSQLYTEYLDTSEKLHQADEENKRITRYLEQILKEIEEKAPILRKQREDYERALETINTLHTQIDDSIEELERQRLESEEAHRRSSYLGRENERLNLQVKDLSKQVTVLLTQVEAARAGLPAPPLSALDDLPDGTNASDVIDQHLVAFRDVSELQEQNSKLLASLRDLTEKLESAEKIAVEARTQELQDELQQAQKDLNELTNGRERTQAMVENITRQRDMYRTLANQQSVNATSPGHTPTSVSNEEVEKLKKELQDSQHEINKLRKEHEEYRQERDKNGQMERAEFERVKAFCDKTRNENVRLLTQAEYNEERLKTLQNNCDAYQRQLNAIEEKNTTLQGIVGRHEGTIESLREHILSLTKKLSQAEVAATNLREEKALFKETEARLLAERDSLHRSQYSQSVLFSNLEAIKNNLERNDSGVRMRNENTISDLTEQCSKLKAKIESNIDLKEAQAKVAALEDQLKSAKDDIATLKKSLASAEQQLNESKKQIQAAQQENSRINTGVSPVLNRIRATSPQAGSPSTPRGPAPAFMTNTVRELQVQLSEERAKTASLQGSLQQLKKSADNLKEAVTQQETQIKESTESNKAAQEEINSLRKSLEGAQAEIKALQEKLTTSQENEKAIKETMDDQLMKITEDLEGRENELEETQKKLDDAKKSEQKAMEQLREQSRIASEMQDKYEREVMFHGADLKALTSLKEKLSEHGTQIESISVAKLKAEEALADMKAGFEDREGLMKKASEDLKARTQELEEQNKSLLEQFTQLSDKMSNIQAKLSSTDGDAGNASFSEDDARTSDQLREIIKYLRREREVAATKVEVAQSEILRLEAQKKSLEGQADLLNKYLTEEREKNQTSLESAGKYGELMRKVHTMDALADSNRLMREEKDDIKHSLTEARAKVLSLETQIEPLQEKLRETSTKLESVTNNLTSVESEKESYKKRSQELVQKLNKARPEDMIKLQQDLSAAQKNIQVKDAELTRIRKNVTHLTTNLQKTVANKNQLQQQVHQLREEVNKAAEENKKLSQEKVRLQQQAMVSAEKVQQLETSAHTMQASQQQEQKRAMDQRNHVLQQLVELRQKEEMAKKEVENVKKALEQKDATLKETESKLLTSVNKIEILQKQTSQLRKIANKYKMKVESNPEGGESSSTAEDAEERKALKPNEGPAASVDQVNKLKEEIQKRDAEISKLKSEAPQDGGSVSKLQSDLELKSQELQKANTAYTQLKDKVGTQITEINRKLDESQSKKAVYESRITMLERERESSLQQIEALNKKLSMQQKVLENMQKQAATGQKVSPGVMSLEKPTSDPPPTANIKPMAAPTPAVSSPRAQVSAPGGSGPRSIPTASIRPMAPTPTVVQPMEAHSGGDGAVSSTVTLPQATVTPTPVASASTTTQAFPPTLTATVSPTPISQSFVGVSATEPSVVPTPSGSADALISQAIALVAPQVEDRPGGQKRKLEVVEEEEEEDEEEAKRSRMLLEEEEEEEEAMRAEEDVGEPSSSSSHPGERKAEQEVLILSSDEEGQVPSSHMEEDREEEVPDPAEGGREAEAEAERSDRTDAPSSTPSSSIQPPPRPLHEPPSSSRQSLPPFHPVPSYEESVEDRIVPSTPTLFVSRPCEGPQGEVSSLQVPSQGFEFGESSAEAAVPSSGGISQIAEGGTIDVTRMDLGQLDEGTHRSMPTTPVRRSPAVEVTTEGNISSSGGDAIEVSSDVVSEAASSASAQQSAQAQSEPDSGIRPESLLEAEIVSDDETDDGMSRDAVVSSQEEAEEEDEDDEIDAELGDPEEDVEDDDDDDFVEAEEEPSPIRATRSSSSARASQSTSPSPSRRPQKITPITWGSPEDSTMQRQSIPRGMRGHPGGRRITAPNQRGSDIRGGQRARRSRPPHGRSTH